MQLRFIALAALVMCGSSATAQGFTCRGGTQPSCLGYGDTVCSSSGRCVDQYASCFDTYQCNYEGFTCKSNVTECVDTYDDLLRTHNALVDDYNSLLSERDTLLESGRIMARDLDNTGYCLQLASTLEDAKACEWQ
jgi:hypothetical protein